MFAVQQGIQTTAHNIANVNTEGYSRQRQILGAAQPFPIRNGFLGTGVEQISVDRITDEFVLKQLVAQNSSFAATDTQAQALRQIEEVLNEQEVGGISAALNDLYDAFSDLSSAAEPGAPVEREAVRASAQSLIDAFQRADGQLRQMQRDADGGIQSTIAEINHLASQIAELNVEIGLEAGRGPANDLMDERDRLLRELGSKIDISTVDTANSQVMVFLAGGFPLVDGNSARTLEAQVDPTNPFDPSFSLVIFNDGSATTDITNDIGGGQLGGLLRVRDTILPAAIRSLDTIAYNLVDSVNTVHAAGTGLDGTVGDFFQATGQVEDAARDLALDANIAASTDAIAAGLTTDPGDNENASNLAALRNTAAALFLPGDPPGPATGPARTLLEHTSFVIADIGQQTRDMQFASAREGQILEVLENRRDEASGVSLDEEATNLIRLQAAFQANARVVSVVDRLLQDLVSII